MKDKWQRYARHLMLPEIGGAGQARLEQAEIAVIGLGGLGAPACLYLAAAGIGRLRLIDDDVVELSNLQRQILFDTAAIGEAKTEAAIKRLLALNPDCRLIARAERLDAGNAARLIANADMVLDGSDNFATRFAVNSFCVSKKRPLISGAVGRWSGQMGVFAGPLASEATPCYRCFVPEPPPQPEICAQTGIIGALTGLVGARMALEAIKLVAGAGTSHYGRIWLIDALSGSERMVSLARDPRCPECGPNAER